MVTKGIGEWAPSVCLIKCFYNRIMLDSVRIMIDLSEEGKSTV